MSLIKTTTPKVKRWVTVLTTRGHEIDVYPNGYLEKWDESIGEYVDLWKIQDLYTEEEIEEIKNAGLALMKEK